MKKIWMALFGFGLLGSVAQAEPLTEVQALKAWRDDRTKKLTAPDGWLALTGLHFLKNGENTVGSAASNAIVLSSGPAHLGVVALSDDGVIRLLLSPGADARVDGREVLSSELLDDARTMKPTLVTSGTMTFYVVDRAGKKALRVRDSESERRAKFPGLDYFPYNPAWRIQGKWEAFPRPRQIELKNILGQDITAMVLGKVSFEHDGRMFEILPIQEHADDPLFFVISDLTSGAETYEAARFLEAAVPGKDGVVILDFNRAVNPPCAFTPFATCPLPPQENQLPLLIQAGEKKFTGAVH